MATTSGVSSPKVALKHIKGESKKKGFLDSVYRGNKKQKDIPEGARQRTGTITLPFNVGKRKKSH